jgi:hypothetical protein
LGNVPLNPVADEPQAEGEIVCHECLGGLLKHFERQRRNCMAALSPIRANPACCP